MTFALDLRRFAAKYEKQAELVVSKICTDLSRNIIMKTPVDTGRLRGNWQASANQVITTSVQTIDRSGAATIGAVIPQAIRAVGGVFYLQNNLPYAAVAEFGLWGKPPGSANGPKTTDGYSTQAPAGMVRLSINEISRFIR